MWGWMEVDGCAANEGRCKAPGHANEDEAKGPSENGWVWGGCGVCIGHCAEEGEGGGG